MDSNAQETIIAQLQAENAILRSRLKEYEDMYGPLRPQQQSSSSSSETEEESLSPIIPTATTTTSKTALPRIPSMTSPLHPKLASGAAQNIAASTLVVDFSQDGNVVPNADKMVFPNPYAEMLLEHVHSIRETSSYRDAHTSIVQQQQKQEEHEHRKSSASSASASATAGVPPPPPTPQDNFNDSIFGEGVTSPVGDPKTKADDYSPSHSSQKSPLRDSEDELADEPPTFPLRPSFAGRSIVTAMIEQQKKQFRLEHEKKKKQHEKEKEKEKEQLLQEVKEKQEEDEKTTATATTKEKTTTEEEPEKLLPHINTQLVIYDPCPNDPHHPSSIPIYQTATFVQPSITKFGSYDYTRSGNPTRLGLEILSAKLEGAYASFAFATGMAALGSLLQLLKPGDRVLACSDLYGGMHRLLSHARIHQGLEVQFVDTTNLDLVKRYCCEVEPPPKLIHLESPSNPLMKITDLKAVAEIAHQVGALVSVDATMMTPLRMQPLQLGCDICVHSGTKFFGGHSDTMVGICACKEDHLAKRIGFIQNATGSALSPFDCFLTLRGMKTMALRLDRQEINAVAIAQYLSRCTHFVKKLYYIGLKPSDKKNGDVDDVVATTPEMYERHCNQASGPGTVMSFETGDVEVSRKFVDACKLFKLTVSFGSCNSLVELPSALSHASIKKEDRTLPEDLVRLSIGIEHVFDLIADLNHAMNVALNVA